MYGFPNTYRRRLTVGDAAGERQIYTLRQKTQYTGVIKWQLFNTMKKNQYNTTEFVWRPLQI